jgi:predicted deacylase
MSSRHYEEIPVTTLASGHRVTLPLHRLTGDQPGPTLGITALVHGDEPLPLAALRAFFSEIDLARLKGTLLIMPVANPLAYEGQTRHSPVDGINLNRYFPGAPDGYVTEQIANAIVTKFLPQVQFLIDLHSGGTYPVVDYVYLSKIRPAMSFAFGDSLLYDGPGYRGTLSGMSEEQNIPTVVVELGGGSYAADDHYVRHGVRGIFNVMKHLGMWEGVPEVPSVQTVVKQMGVIHPRVGGVLYPEIGLDQLGKIIPGGTVLGRIYSPYTFEEIEVLRAPFARNYTILLRGMIARVNPGDFAYMCANADVG